MTMSTYASIAELDKIYMKSRAAQAILKNKDRTIECPHPVMNYSSNSGTYEKVKVDCSMGVGDWCKMCQFYRRHVYQERFGKQGYIDKREHIQKKTIETGLIPHLWKKPSAERVVGES